MPSLDDKYDGYDYPYWAWTAAIEIGRHTGKSGVDCTYIEGGTLSRLTPYQWESARRWFLRKVLVDALRDTPPIKVRNTLQAVIDVYDGSNDPTASDWQRATPSVPKGEIMDDYTSLAFYICELEQAVLAEDYESAMRSIMYYMDEAKDYTDEVNHWNTIHRIYRSALTL
jgi:hypothetical protein